MTTAQRAFARGRQSDRWLKLSLDRKVSPNGWYQDSRRRWVPSVPNSFGLPAGITCPGLTPFCDSCYAVRTENMGGVRQLLDHNYRLLTRAANVDQVTHLLAEMVGRFQRAAITQTIAARDMVFRIHWSGDFYSVEYAQAWARVIRGYPNIKFWAYTRSFVPPVNVVPVLAGIPNLALYLSVDVWNADFADEQYTPNGVRRALCGVDYSTARLLDGDRPAVCPENNGRLPLMADGRGACVECRLCIDGRRDVIFSTSHREQQGVPVRIVRKPIITTPLPAAPTGPQFVGLCQNRYCRTSIYRQPGAKGRTPKYCCKECRWAGSRQKAA